MATIAMLHPGAMGATVGGLLVEAGHEVRWASAGRSEATRQRAVAAGLRECASLATTVADVHVVISLCPPSAASDVARTVADHGFAGLYVDANAVAPTTVRAIARSFERFVDGAVVGGPPRAGDDIPTRLYLSGADGGDVAGLFDDDALEVVVLDGGIGAASALKMAFAGWTKGTAALAVALRALARAEGVEDAVLAEWDRSLPGMRVAERSGRAGMLAAKAWRFEGELREIAGALAVHDLPDGFHMAAADVYAALAGLRDITDPSVDDVMQRLVLAPASTQPGDRSRERGPDPKPVARPDTD